MDALRYLACAVLSIAAALLATMSAMLVAAALRDDGTTETGPVLYLGVAALFLLCGAMAAVAAMALFTKRSARKTGEAAR